MQSHNHKFMEIIAETMLRYTAHRTRPNEYNELTELTTPSLVDLDG